MAAMVPILTILLCFSQTVLLTHGIKPNNFQKLSLPSIGTESYAFDPDTRVLYTALNDGRIAKSDPVKNTFVDFAITTANRSKALCDGTDGSNVTLRSTCGRQLALAFNHKTKELYIVDAYSGLFVVGLSGGVATPLTPNGHFDFADGIDIDPVTGIVYFTDLGDVLDRYIQTEVNFLGDLIHPNLVKLVGYCIEDDQRLLVYEFMPRGSLENHLFRRSLPLPWSIRIKIALGAAKGLAFLHEEAERPVIYRDFKTSNILLDAEYNSKLSDFGLAKDAPDEGKTHVSTRVMGTYGYAAPEYVMTGHLTSKSDIYSFGVVLLEMLTGRRSMDKNRPNGEHNLVEWARPHLLERKRFYQLIDPRLEGHFSIKAAQKAAQLAARCLSRDPKARPRMSEVVEALKPLPNLKDMASSSYFFRTMQADRVSASPNGKPGLRTQGSFSRNGEQNPRSLSMPNGNHVSPRHQFVQNSPKPKAKP